VSTSKSQAKNVINKYIKQYVTIVVNNIPNECLAVGDRMTEEQVNYIISKALSSEELERYTESQDGPGKQPNVSPSDCSQPKTGKTYEFPCKLTFNKTWRLGDTEIKIQPINLCFIAGAGGAGVLYAALRSCYNITNNIDNYKKCIIDTIMQIDDTKKTIEEVKIDIYKISY